MPGSNSPTGAQTVADAIALFLVRRGVKRVFGLCGGHVQPIWDRAARLGVRIVDVRDERAAAHMAHAHSELTGELGIALVTAGPGMTNSITGIVNAHAARCPLLVISGVPPRPQEGMGALQDLPHAEMIRPVTRYARTVREAAHVLHALDEAVARAEGAGGDPGPAFIEFPTDLLREAMPARFLREDDLRPKAPARLAPDPEAVSRAADLLWSARRPLVISGRGARGAERELCALLDALGAAYLDTGESRGLVPDAHPSVVSALRSQAMAEADLVLTLGRKLDFQLAYGSQAVFRNARFVRAGAHASELRDNRRGEAEVWGTPALTLRALLELGRGKTPAADRAWTAGMRKSHLEKSARYLENMGKAPDGRDGRMHPNRLLACLRDALRPDAVVIADGGDILSFARIGLSPSTYLDPGALGCLGVGVPFGIAAALAFPRRQVLVVSGDGSFGFNAIELDTAVRHGAKAVFVIANNAAWNIELYDQTVTYQGNTIGSELRDTDYAALARALGAHGERVERPEALPGAIKQAFANAPALIDVPVTRDAVSPDAKSGLAWVPDTQPLEAWDAAEKEWRRGTSPD